MRARRRGSPLSGLWDDLGVVALTDTQGFTLGCGGLCLWHTMPAVKREPRTNGRGRAGESPKLISTERDGYFANAFFAASRADHAQRTIASAKGTFLLSPGQRPGDMREHHTRRESES